MPVKGQQGVEGTGASLQGGKAEELGRFSLRKRRPTGNLLHMYTYTNGMCSKDRLFSVSLLMTRGSGCRLKNRGCPLNIWRHFFTMRVTKPWQRLLREVGESPASQILKSHLDMVLSNGIQLIMLEQGLWMA